MIIDAHVHPVLFGPICKDPERVQFRKQQFGLYKSSPIPMEQVMAVMDHAGVDLAILFAEDYSALSWARASSAMRKSACSWTRNRAGSPALQALIRATKMLRKSLRVRLRN